MKIIYGILLVISNIYLNEVQTLNILGVFPYQGKSHFFVFEPFLRELANRGHNVTVISHFPQKQTLSNYTDISLAGKVQVLENVFPLESSYLIILKVAFFLFGEGTDNCRILLENQNVQELWKRQQQFDVVVVEQFNSDCSLGLAYKLGAPVVGITSHTLMPWHYSRFGVPFNPSFVSFQFCSGGRRPTLYQRIEATLIDIYMNTLFKLIGQRVDQNTLEQYFDDVPPLEDLGRDIKFMLLYHNIMLTGSQLFSGNIKEVGGYHVAKPKPLPDDLRKFIEEAEHGVIYISFGSMIKSKSLPEDKFDAIFGAISQLPQRVIWKFDRKTLPGNPKNVYLSDWLPQNDILAHPNVIAFFSHCGMLGVTEAIHHGVPIVGMPIFGDQPSNAASVKESGLGVHIEVQELTKENLLDKFKTVLDSEFRRRVKLLSKAWHDRPVSAMDSAIFWTEFAARNQNFTFRSASADVPLYQYLCLDVALVLILLILPPMFFIKLIIRKILSNRKSVQKDGKKSKRE